MEKMVNDDKTFFILEIKKWKKKKKHICLDHLFVIQVHYFVLNLICLHNIWRCKVSLYYNLISFHCNSISFSLISSFCISSYVFLRLTKGSNVIIHFWWSRFKVGEVWIWFLIFLSTSNYNDLSIKMLINSHTQTKKIKKNTISLRWFGYQYDSYVYGVYQHSQSLQSRPPTL